jgi:carboxynorspermidine decarboxylase
MLDLGKVLHTPSFVLEYDAFERNLAVIANLQEELPCTFLLALKGFGMHAVFPELALCAKGATASSLNEALLASEYFKEVHAYAPAYQSSEFSSLVKLASHVTFNSLAEYHRYENQLRGAMAGLRINPEYSVVGT